VALPLQGVSPFLPLVYASETLQRKNDPWWQLREAVEEFNQNRAEKLRFPEWVAIDESMLGSLRHQKMETYRIYLLLSGNRSH